MNKWKLYVKNQMYVIRLKKRLEAEERAKQKRKDEEKQIKLRVFPGGRDAVENAV